MHKVRIGLILASLFAVLLGTLEVAHAGPPSSGASALKHQTLVQPVRTWRDCQRIARCTGCQPVFHCRSCSYKRTCVRGGCEWTDVCVWGPFLPLAPRGVRIY
jgi:hypothetical protein